MLMHRLGRNCLTVALGLLGSALIACGDEPAADAGATNHIKVACIGDSLTLGTGLADSARESYPAQLAAMLGPLWDVQTFADYGVTMLSKGDKPLYQQNFVPNAIWFEADKVILMFGANDSLPHNWAHAGEFVRDYGDLVGTFSERINNPRVWICHPPPIHATNPADPGWAARIQQELIPKIDEVAAARNIAVIDFNKPMQNRPELFVDGVHPNAAGARLMAEIAYRTITGKEPPTQP